MATPESDIRMTSLGKNSQVSNRAIASVSMLGSKEKLKWKQEGDALVISKPTTLPAWKVSGYKIVLKN
jgi:alpha-L-fucosidase